VFPQGKINILVVVVIVREKSSVLNPTFFNPSKKNYFGCAANRKSQRFLSMP
jgi:hypothetical protein